MIMEYRVLLSVLLLFVAGSIFSQNDEVTGSWKGILTQEQGGYRPTYEFELYLQREGDELTGRSYVKVDDIYAEMELVGEVVNNTTVKFRETRIVNNRKEEGLEWCFKQGALQLKREGNMWKLSGIWVGKSSVGDCIPGKIYLTKEKPQA